MDKFFNTYFSFNGRLNRKPFIIRNIVSIFIILILTIAIIIPLYGLQNAENFNLSVPYFVILFISIWFYLANMNRRFQDMNKGKEWTIILFILYIVGLLLDLAQYTSFSLVLSSVSFVFFIYLCAKKGTVGPNKYGPDPLGNTIEQANDN